jgi:hypothetical protein
MKNEFQEFLETRESVMPSEVERSLLAQMEQKIDPSFGLIFSKVSLIQAFAGLLLISICPQLGVGFSKESFLMDFFMTFGHHACTLLCGSLFLSLGVIGNWLFLTREEWRGYYQKALVFQPLILILSLFILAVLGAEGQWMIFFLWSVGGLITSISLIKLVFKVSVPNNLAL